MIKQKKDIIVVGSGPGGATIARDLTLKKKDVIIIEQGKDNPPKGTAFSAFHYLGGSSLWGKGFILTKEGYQMIRGITTGGSSMLYLGCAWDPPFALFEKYNIDIQMECQEIKDELCVQTIPDHLLGPRAKALTQSATSLGYQWEKIPKFLNADHCQTNCNCCMFGCPHHAKWHARDWILDAVSHGASFENQMKCEKVIIENQRAVGIIAVDQHNNEIQIEADCVILSAGGIGSPSILKRSGIEAAGESFFFDPFIQVIGHMDKPFQPSKEFPMVTGFHLEDEGIMITDMSTPFSVYANNVVFALKPQHIFSMGTSIGLLLKVRDDIQGKITKDEKIMSKPLTMNDKNKLEKGRAICENILSYMGAKKIWASKVAAAHPGGTCRIGHLLNHNLETDCKNLFVVDASVIPEPWGLPPTLTIISLARRLSRYIQKEVMS